MNEFLPQLFKKKFSISYCLLLGLLIFTAIFFSSFVFGIMNHELLNSKTSPSINSYILNDVNEGDESNQNDDNDEIQSWVIRNDSEEEEEDEDGDRISDAVEIANERKLEIEIHDQEVQIRSELRNNENKDDIEIDFKLNDGPSFDVHYKSKAGSDEIDLEFEIRFYSLIEYIDSNSDNIYSDSKDQNLQEIKFDSIAFLPIQFLNQSVHNASLNSFYAISEDEVFSLRFYLSNEFIKVNESLITPTEMKIDIEIKNFPYLQNNSKLALKIQLEAEKEYEHDDETEDELEGRSSNETGLVVTMNGFKGFFSWSEFALVDGQNQTVVTSPVESDEDEINSQRIYFNYPRGSNIIHDPKIGVAGILKSSIIPSELIKNFLTILKLSKEGYLAAVIVFTGVVVLGLLMYRKKYT